ncbi:hypothetical protein Q8A67_000214 [Cirrhinus molitorella]|uniref:Neurotransmitter-gated ion-channel ligand-binding domain-containing protein n=1 Tax=Cirrhinus molitorella TaxID=172907 RepID=A0AA88QF34_9TELE|nr:hypothetical protein Q8A67_000214 [Cirrhinus molitorella]
MDLYKFPFDSHTCNITLQSTAYSVYEISIDEITNADGITGRSKELFQAQGEWELIEINVTKAFINIIYEDLNLDQLIYQAVLVTLSEIRMKNHLLLSIVVLQFNKTNKRRRVCAGPEWLES